MHSPNQTFDAKQLGWMRRWHSQAHLRTKDGTRPQSPEEWDAFLSNVSDQIAKDTFPFSGLRWHSVRRKRALSTNLLEDTLVIRKMNDNVRRAYGISQPNRHALIKVAKQAIRENTPKTILRLDLRNCFESICRVTLLRELRHETKVSTQTTALLDSLFKRASLRLGGKMPQGIPRGLTISTSLAELRLQKLDRALRVLPGTYLYLRYVDDILIFSTLSETEAFNAVTESIARSGFSLNLRKSRALRVACKCDEGCAHGSSCPCKKDCNCLNGSAALTEIEYLGYKLIFAKHNASKPREPNAVYCMLSDKKANRIKSRIVHACVDCERNLDWILFEDRIRYLVGNQRVSALPGKRGLFNGLSYTHPDYDPPCISNGSGSLDDLDRFYRARLRSTVKKLGTPGNISKLQKLTFEFGFKDFRRTKFSGQRMKQIQLCWD